MSRLASQQNIALRFMIANDENNDVRCFILRLSDDEFELYIDYSKAFDAVSHDKLFIRLAAYGITGTLLK